MIRQPSPGRLDGITVAVTRSSSRAASLSDMLVSLGANVVGVPVIDITVAADQGAALRAAVDGLGADDLLVVTSAHAVDVLDDLDCRRDLRTAAVGSATSRALVSSGFNAPIVPSRQMARHLAEAVGTAFGSGRALFPAAEAASDDVVDGLASLGWRVDRVEAYRTVTVDVHPALAAVAARADVVVFTSGSTVRGWRQNISTPVPGVSIGPATSGVMRSLEVEVAAEAVTHDLDGVCAAVVGYVHGQS